MESYPLKDQVALIDATILFKGEKNEKENVVFGVTTIV